MIDYKELEARLDLRELIAPGKRISGNKPVLMRCPYHDDKRDSLAIYSNDLHCFGCGKHQSVLDWLAEKEHLDIKRDFKGTIEVLAAKYGNAPITTPLPKVKAPPPKKELKPMDPAVARRYHDNLGEKREWFRRRTLSDRIIDGQLLGYDGRAFTIPVWHPSGDLLTIRFRRDDSLGTQGPKYYGIEGRNQTLLYNQGALTGSRSVVICEGELDTLVLWQEGIPAVSSTNGAHGMVSIWEDVKHLFRCERILVSLDQDEAGRRNARELLRIIGTGQHFVQGAVILRWNKKFGKDITEVAQNKGIGYLKELIRC
jgi:DNA primase